MVADAGDLPHEPPGRLEVVEEPCAEVRVEAAMLRDAGGLEILVAGTRRFRDRAARR